MRLVTGVAAGRTGRESTCSTFKSVGMSEPDGDAGVTCCLRDQRHGHVHDALAAKKAPSFSGSAALPVDTSPVVSMASE